MRTTKKHYIVEGGKALEVLQAHQKADAAWLAKVREIIAPLGLEGIQLYMRTHDDLDWLLPSDAPNALPKGLKRDAQDPKKVRINRRTKQGKAWAQELMEVAPWDHLGMTETLFPGGCYCRGFSDGRVFYAGFGPVSDGRWVVKMTEREGQPLQPIDGLREIKASEYHTLIESQMEGAA
jgi:hypothetical protein